MFASSALLSPFDTSISDNIQYVIAAEVPVDKTILGVTASRRLPSRAQIDFMREHIELCRWFHLGACVGGDEAAFDIAVEHPSIAIVVHPPLDERWMMPRSKWTMRKGIYVLPAKDYIPRNHDIVRASYRMIACPDGPERMRGSGTWATIRQAERVRKRVTICYPNGKIDDRIPE